MVGHVSLTEPFSLSELRFYLTRAGVGAGAPFGVAEDFAEMAVCVARMGIDPSGLAAAALEALATGDGVPTINVCDDRLVPETGGVISCMFAGGVLYDQLSVRTAPSGLTLGPVDCPLLVAAFMCAMEDGLYVVTWPDGTLVVRDSVPVCMAAHDVPQACNAAAVTMTVRPDGQVPRDVLFDQNALRDACARPSDEGVCMDRASWAVIYEYFERYLVPSSEEARATAAGAGLVDTD